MVGTAGQKTYGWDPRSIFFSDKDYVFGPYKYGSIQIGGVRLPLQPLVYIRIPKTMQQTMIAGSSQDPDLSGGTVKEMMGIGEAKITIEGVMMSTDPTIIQDLANRVGISNASESEPNCPLISNA